MDESEKSLSKRSPQPDLSILEQKEAFESMTHELLERIDRTSRSLAGLRKYLAEGIISDTNADWIEKTPHWLESYNDLILWDTQGVRCLIERLLRKIDPDFGTTFFRTQDELSSWIRKYQEHHKVAGRLNLDRALPKDVAEKIKADLRQLKRSLWRIQRFIRDAIGFFEPDRSRSIAEYCLYFQFLDEVINESGDKLWGIARAHAFDTGELKKLADPISNPFSTPEAVVGPKSFFLQLMTGAKVVDNRVHYSVGEKIFVIGFILAEYLAIDRVALLDALKEGFKVKPEYRDRVYDALVAGKLIHEGNLDKDQKYKQRVIDRTSVRVWPLSVDTSDWLKVCEAIEQVPNLP